MKLRYLSFLAMLVPLSAAQSPEFLEYHSLCSGEETGGTRTFDNGVTSDYTCRIKASGNINRQETLNSAEECAAKCGEGCPGAVWEYTKKNCIIYDSPVTLTPHGRGSVYLKPIQGAQDHGEESVSTSECLHEKQACEDELAHLLGISKICQSEQEALALENQQCQERNDDLETISQICQRESDGLHTKLQDCYRERDGLETENKSCKLEKDELDTKSKTCQREKDDLETRNKTCQREKDELDTKSKTCQRDKDDLETRNKTCQREKDELETKNKEQIENLQSQLDQCRNRPNPPLSSASCPSSHGKTFLHAGHNWQVVCNKGTKVKFAGQQTDWNVSRDQCLNICVQRAQCVLAHYRQSPVKVCVTYTTSAGPEVYTEPNSGGEVYLKM